MKIAYKILLVVGTVAVPIVLVAAWFVVAGINRDIATAELEKAGNEYQRPLEAILEGLGRHHRLTQLAPAVNGLAEKIASSEQTIDQGFAQLRQVQQRLGGILQVTPKV